MSATQTRALDADLRPRRSSAAKSIFIVASGNFLEMFDFMVFGYYASAIAKAYFPADDEFTSLLLALTTFGAGFLMRPLGALILGAYVDRHGRKQGLLVTLGLMAIGTMAIGLTPTYAQIGIAAPIIIVVARLIQGLSAGVEVGGVSVFLSEIAPPNRRGFYCAWQSASQQVAVVFAAAIGLAVGFILDAPEVDRWGWRVPFLLGCAMLPVLFFIRSHVEETDAFLNRADHPTLTQILRTTAANWGVILQGTLMAVMTTVFFYMITAYTPTYGGKVLALSANASLAVTACVGLANFMWLPVAGALSDRVGRRSLLIASSLAGALIAWPAMSWLVAAPSFGRLLTVELVLALVYASYNGAFIVFLTESVPAEVRTVGFSMAYSLATAVFGGFTPAICTALINATGNKAIPGIWCAAAALLSFLALAAGKRRAAS